MGSLGQLSKAAVEETPGVLTPRLEFFLITLNRLMVSGSSWKLGGQGLQGGWDPWVNSGPGPGVPGSPL